MTSCALHDEEIASVERHLNEVVLARTGSAVHDLSVVMRDDRRILCGRASRYYVKQVAQIVARELDPHVHWENRIAVVNESGERLA